MLSKLLRRFKWSIPLTAPIEEDRLETVAREITDSRRPAFFGLALMGVAVMAFLLWAFLLQLVGPYKYKSSSDDTLMP